MKASVAEGVAALYAYERQVPAGRRFQDRRPSGQALWRERQALDQIFFAVHGVMDIEHSGAEREMLGDLTHGADPQPIEAATARALEAWWNFLSAVDRPLNREQSRGRTARTHRDGGDGPLERSTVRCGANLGRVDDGPTVI